MVLLLRSGIELRNPRKNALLFCFVINQVPAMNRTSTDDHSKCFQPSRFTKTNFALEPVIKAQSVSGGISILFLEPRCSMGVDGYPGNDTETVMQEVGWAPGPVWKGAENLACY